MSLQTNETTKTTKSTEKTKTTEITKINNIYKTIMTPQLTKIVNSIEKIAEKNKDETKSKETKQAEACFTLLGNDMNSICKDKDHDGYRLKFFQCMDCSH